MAQKDIVFVLFLCCLFSTLGVARGRTFEDSELEEELKRLNKPAVEIIQTKYGDTYGCVDFYEQPAFDHPFLKDYKYNYKMPKSKMNRDSSDLLHPKNIWLNGKGCPDGTVPIKRITKDGLIRAKQAANVYGSKYNSQTADNPGVHYAVVRTYGNNYRINGAGMNTSIYNPIVQYNQFSGSHMLLQNGDDSIEVGWIVHPKLYKDNQTRLFIFTKTQKGQCFNTDCPGFIYFNTEIPLDSVFYNVTPSGGLIYLANFFIYKDALNGDWFLNVGNDKQLGSWPSKIFGSLSDTANYVEWGGETYSPPGVPSPPMGSGAPKLIYDPLRTAFCSMIEVVDANHNVVYAEDLEEFVNPFDYYFVKNYGKMRGFYKTIALFGGAGGYTGE